MKPHDGTQDRKEITEAVRNHTDNRILGDGISERFAGTPHPLDGVVATLFCERCDEQVPVIHKRRYYDTDGVTPMSDVYHCEPKNHVKVVPYRGR